MSYDIGTGVSPLNGMVTVVWRTLVRNGASVGRPKRTRYDPPGMPAIVAWPPPSVMARCCAISTSMPPSGRSSGDITPSLFQSSNNITRPVYVGPGDVGPLPPGLGPTGEELPQAERRPLRRRMAICALRTADLY